KRRRPAIRGDGLFTANVGGKPVLEFGYSRAQAEHSRSQHIGHVLDFQITYVGTREWNGSVQFVLPADTIVVMGADSMSYWISLRFLANCGTIRYTYSRSPSRSFAARYISNLCILSSTFSEAGLRSLITRISLIGVFAGLSHSSHNSSATFSPRCRPTK